MKGPMIIVHVHVQVKPADVVTVLDPKEDVPVSQPKQQQGFVQNVVQRREEARHELGATTLGHVILHRADEKNHQTDRR